MISTVVLVGLFTGLSDWLMRGLAVVGAVAVGGFGAGLIVQLAARLLSTKPAPRGVVRIVRILGAITGLVIALYLFPGSGPGGGGSGSGGGKDSGQGESTVNVAKDQAPSKEPAKTETPPGPTELRIVVVKGSDGRAYRIDGKGPAQSLDEVKGLIDFRKSLAPGLDKLIIVLYEDSPDQDTVLVRRLETLAREKGLTPEISKPKGKVP